MTYAEVTEAGWFTPSLTAEPIMVIIASVMIGLFVIAAVFEK